MEITKLTAEPRTDFGTRTTRALRKTGRIPVVIYGHNQPVETVSLVLEEVELALSQGARTLKIEMDGKTEQHLVKEVQYDHFGHSPIHLDLTRVALDERVQVRIGIDLRGVPKGISEGGSLDQHLSDLEIECLVTEIPETLHPLVTELGLEETLFVKDLELPPGVTVLTDPDERVATVRPLLAEAEEDMEAEDGEAVQPEVIGRARKEEEEDEKEP